MLKPKNFLKVLKNIKNNIFEKFIMQNINLNNLFLIILHKIFQFLKTLNNV